MSISISFFSNFFNAHQLPVAKELNANPCVDFAFIAMQRIEGLEGRVCLNDRYPFVVKQYLGNSEAEQAMAHAIGDDIVVFGDMAGDESYVRARAKTGKPFFRYSERLLKRGDWWAYVPPKRYRTYDRFTRYNDCPMYVLCASGYTARDLDKFGYPVERCLKWGYFPQVDASPVEARRPLPRDVALCSAQRLIPWKRVDLQVRMAKELKDRNVPFRLTIAGGGEEELSLKELACKLRVDDRVTFVGALSSEDTLALMRSSDVFLATSNRKEGWGGNGKRGHGCRLCRRREQSDWRGAFPHRARCRRADLSLRKRGGFGGHDCRSIERFKHAWRHRPSRDGKGPRSLERQGRRRAAFEGFDAAFGRR